MLEHLFGSKTRIKLLQIFFRNPEKPFFVRELVRMADLQLNTIRRELANLEAIGIIVPVAEVVGEENTGTKRSKYYHLNGGNLLVPELKSLLFKAQVLEEQQFISTIQNKVGNLSYFLLTGIFCNVTASATDMLLVGTIKESLLEKMVKDFEKVVGVPIRYTVMSVKEYEERREIGDRFLYSVLEAKHIVVIDRFSVN